MKKYFPVLAALLLTAILSAAERLPEFRYTKTAPFKNTRPVAAVWSKADILSPFINARSYDASSAQTEVRGLFDEKNLYLTIRGDFDERFRNERKDKDLFSSNNFEIFFQPQPGGHYVQLAVDDKGRLYTAYGREESKFAGTAVKVQKGKNFWTADLVIPFTDLRMKSPVKDQVVQFCVMRTNFCTWNGKQEVSAYTPLGWNFHLPDLWAKVKMTRNGETAGMKIAGPSNCIQVNLVPNGEFDIPFKTYPNVERTETMAMSGEWILRATGPIYQFHSFRPVVFKKNTQYTLRIKARNIGNDGNLRIVQLKRQDGKYKPGRYIVMNLSLGPQFHEYFLPFTTTQEYPWSIVLYKVGGKTPGSGVEIASVKVCEGKISPFEVRKLGRAGNQRVVKGTAPAKERNFYGTTALPLNVLAIINNKYGLREPLDIFENTGVKYHTLVTTGKDQDIYETDQTPAEISEFLEKNRYDVYFIGSNTIQNIGKELYGKILAGVKKGAGLYVGAHTENPRYSKLVKDAGSVSLPADALEKAAFPAGMYNPTKKDGGTPADGMRKGSIGKGQVLFTENPKPVTGQPFKVRMAYSDAGKVMFPLDKYADAALLRLAFLLSGKNKVLLEKINVKDGKLVLRSATLPAGTQIHWQIADKHGQKVTEGKGKFTSPVMEIPISVSSSGKHIVSVHAMKDDGRTVDYTAEVFENKGPALTGFTSAETFTSRDTANFRFRIQEFAPGMKIRWTLADFSGRILEKGAFAAKEENSFSAPLNAFYTNMGKVTVTLEKDGKILDTLRENIYVRDLDRKRIYNDYIVAVWPGYGTDSYLREINSQLENIGIRHHVIPLSGVPATLSAGFSSGTSWIGGGEIFCGWPQKTNVRAQQFNTAKARKRIAERAEKAYTGYTKYGVVQSAVSDEPNFNRRDSSSELDEHPENVAAYRSRLEKKFGTIGNYNKRHKTAHRSFADITPTRVAEARKKGNYSEFVQWRSFNVDRWCEIIRLISDTGKKIDPEAKLSLMNSFGQTAFSGNDYWKLLTKAGLNVSNEYTAAVYFGKNPLYNFDEFYRSFRPDMRVWGFIGYFYTKTQTDFAPWWFALNRYGGFTWYATTTWGYNVVDNPTGALTLWGKELRESIEKSRITKGIGKIFTDYQWRKNSIGIYYSHESMILSYALGKETRGMEVNQNSPLYNYYYSRQGISFLLEELLHQYDFIAPEQILNGKLASYKVLFLPRILTLSDKEVAILKAFAAKGGRLIADIMPGMYDELGAKRDKAPFTEAEVTVIGRNFNELDREQKKAFAKVFAEKNVAPILVSEGIENLNGREAMHFVRGGMNVYGIMRMPGRSSDTVKQTFIFPSGSKHLYDIRAGKYLGKTDSVTVEVPNGNVLIYGHYPYKVESLAVTLPAKVKAGRDLTASVALKTDSGKAGDHVFHIEVLDPAGKGRFHMKRNVTALNGKYTLSFRMAHNDMKGKWLLKVTDAMTGITAEKAFILD